MPKIEKSTKTSRKNRRFSLLSLSSHRYPTRHSIRHPNTMSTTTITTTTVTSIVSTAGGPPVTTQPIPVSSPIPVTVTGPPPTSAPATTTAVVTTGHMPVTTGHVPVSISHIPVTTGHKPVSGAEASITALTTPSSFSLPNLNPMSLGSTMTTACSDYFRAKSQEFTLGHPSIDPLYRPSLYNPVTPPSYPIMNWGAHWDPYDSSITDVKPLDVKPKVKAPDVRPKVKPPSTTTAVTTHCQSDFSSSLQNTLPDIQSDSKQKQSRKKKKKSRRRSPSTSSSSSSSSSSSEQTTTSSSSDSESDSDKSKSRKHKHDKKHPSIKLRNYDPSVEDWADYDDHAKMVAKINHWKDKTLLRMVIASMTGQAKTIIGTFSRRKKKTYKRLSKAMTKFYSASNKEKAVQSKLDTRLRKKDESVDDLALSIRELTMKAYRKCTSRTISKVSVQYFLKALNDDKLQADVLRLPHSTLEEAMNSALQAEAAIDFERRRGLIPANTAKARPVQSKPNNRRTNAGPAKPYNQNTDQSSKPRNQQGQNKFRGTCFNCDKPNHHWKVCRNPLNQTKVDSAIASFQARFKSKQSQNTNFSGNPADNADQGNASGLM